MSERDRREAILEAAGRLLRHYGPFKTTVADIAREAGIGVGTVYLEFRTKDAILEALSGARHERVLRAVELAWGDGRPAARRLEGALAARIDAFLEHASDGAHGADLFACACPAIARAHREFRERERALFARFLRDAAGRGELAVRDPELDAGTLLLAYRAFEPPLVLELAASVRDRALARVHRLLLEGLVPR